MKHALFALGLLAALSGCTGGNTANREDTQPVFTQLFSAGRQAISIRCLLYTSPSPRDS